MTTTTGTSAATAGLRQLVRRWWPLAAVLVLAALLVVTRLTGLGRSLWWDEAYTAFAFIRRDGVARDPAVYIANNHTLFTALTAWTARRLGSMSEPVLRLWSVVPALAGCAVMTIWLWRRVDPRMALSWLFLITISTTQARYATEARGYGIVFLATCLTLIAATEGLRSRSTLHDVQFAAWTAIGSMAVPTVALASVGNGLLLLARPAHRLRLLLVSAVAGAAVLAWYWPLLGRLLEDRTGVGARSGETVTVLNAVVLPFRYLGAPVVTGPIAWLAPVATVLTLTLGVAGVRHLWLHHRQLGLQALAALISSMLLMGLLGMHVLERYILFLLPATSVLLAAGVLATYVWLFARAPRATTIGAALLAAVLLATGVRAVQQVTNVPRQDFAGPAAAVLEAEPDHVIAADIHVGFSWYLRDLERTSEADVERLTDLVCTELEGTIAYLGNPNAEVPMELPCFREDGWRLISSGEGEATIDVWIRDAG